MTLQGILITTRQHQLYQNIQNCAEKLYIADDFTEAYQLFKTTKPDLIILDDLYGSDKINQFITTINNIHEEPPAIIVISDSPEKYLDEYPDDSSNIYFFDKTSDESLEKIIQQIQNSSNDIHRGTQNDASRFFINDFAASVTLAGHSCATRDLLSMIEMIGSSRCNPVLIVGETGTGKEIVARAIHKLRSPDEQYVAKNCAALTSTLLESELFGHVKGSFTGADRDKTGLMELAGNGTLFLDEISEMPLELQAKLLRVLQEKNFRKVGGTTTIPCNALIIASSNRNLLEEVEQKRFRRDLYYRLSICPISVKPLRSDERKDDIKLLAEYFLHSSDICPEKKNRIKSFTPLAIEALERHHWPGNVRELRNVIDRAILLERKDRIGLESIIIDRNDTTETGQALNPSDFSLAKAERQLIARALRETGWQKTKAAALLGITRATLYAKVKQYNIQKDTTDTDNQNLTTTCPAVAVEA